MTEKFIIGLVGAPFGVKGFVKVRPCSGEIDHLLELQSVLLCKDGKEKLYKIEESSPAHTGSMIPAVLIRFEGINSPEDAKVLSGAQLLVKREQAAPLKNGEFYIEDLKGLPVFANNENTLLGHITDIIEGGGGELVEIQLTNGDKKLVPFRKEFFTEINPKKNRVSLENLWILD
jgi:16S rRNA processing protein RimM